MQNVSFRWLTTTTIAMAALGAVIAPASAAPASVDTKCGTYICVHTAHHGQFVQDITVETRDGLPGKLRSWWGTYSGPAVNGARGHWTVGREESASLVCGSLERSGREIEQRCVSI